MSYLKLQQQDNKNKNKKQDKIDLFIPGRQLYLDKLYE